MDKMAFASSTRGGCFIFLFFLIIDVISAQEGFISIECCAQSDNIEPNTNISWTSDDSFFHNKVRCQSIHRPVYNDTSYDLSRVFDKDTASKWCYNLTTVDQQDYLIRATFLHGLSVRTSPDTIFNFSIGPTSIEQMNSSDDSSEVEGIFRATNWSTDFCLVKVRGSPYLSKLELRPLNGFQYPNGNSSVILKLISRIDVGNTRGLIRYPTDLNDRIWKTNESLSGNASNIPTPGSTPINTTANIHVPLEVLQTAAAAPKQLVFLQPILDPGNNDYMIILHFLELDSSVKKGERVFDIYMNGVKVKESFDILENNTCNYKEVVLNVAANRSLNISLIKVSTDALALGPLCNAYEIFLVHERMAGTDQRDVAAVLKVRDDLLEYNPENDVLGGWSGDPCLPSPWKRLGCEPSNESFIITKLDLSSNDLQGFLPASISELTELKEINVRQNNLKGSIPESFASLQHLAYLSFGCNQLNHQLPPDLLNRSNLLIDDGDCVNEGPSRTQPARNTLIIGSIAGGSVLVTLAIGVIFICLYRRTRHNVVKHSMTKNAVFSVPSMDDFELKPIYIHNFSLVCIEASTCKYKTMIGEGGFGAVYRGTLPHGQEVAVKVRSATSTQGTREFENELNLLSAIRHENLVPLLGYCCENDQQILVYPFMSNGSLQDRLYGTGPPRGEVAKRKPLDWQTRLSIALGAARGLLYLHTFAGRCVIHRDVKSSNILLDHSMCAKVADFGFSKYAPQEGDSGASLEVRGTAGYLDPEYYSTQQLSTKSDVFSFGVVLLEIISGREPLNIHRPRNEWSLVEWAKPFIREARIEEIVDPTIKGGYHAESMWRVVEAALACVETFSAYRPSMADIVRELEDAFIIENNASEYMKSIESIGGSNRFISIDRKILPAAATPTPSEPSPILSQPMAPPLPR